jgi:hypothetical protein
MTSKERDRPLATSGKTLAKKRQLSKEEAWAEADRLRAKIGRVSDDSTRIIREWRDNDERYR